MNYSEAKDVLKKQEEAKSVVAKYEGLADAHKKYGFKTRRDFIQALQQVDGRGGSRKTAVRGKRRRAASAGGRGLPEATVSQIKSMKADGKSNAEISRQTKVSPLTVAKYVKGIKGARAKAAPKKAAVRRAGKRAGAKRGAGRGRAVSAAVVNRIKSMKAEGKSNAEISRATKVSPMTVSKYLKGGATAGATE